MKFFFFFKKFINDHNIKSIIIYIHIHIYIHAYLHIHLHKNVYTYINTCIQKYVHKYIHTYTRTYINNNLNHPYLTGTVYPCQRHYQYIYIIIILGPYRYGQRSKHTKPQGKLGIMIYFTIYICQN